MRRNRHIDVNSDSSTGSVSSDLLTRERAPPPRPVPLEFPKHLPPRTSHPLSRRRMISLRSSLIRLKRPTDLSDGIICHLNVHLDTDVALSAFVPDQPFQQRPFLYDSDLDAMLNELDVCNEDAYREIMRLPPLEGRTRPRLTYTRNFFVGLEDISHYYDDSKDEYYEVEVAEEERKQEDGNSLGDTNGDTKMSYEDLGPTSSDSDSSTLPKELSQSELKPHTATSDIPKQMKQVYKGARLSNALSLPPPARNALIRNFLKIPTHKFTCRDYDPPAREKLRICDVNVPQGLIMYSFSVVKTPSDVKLARGRFVEGPVMGCSVRHEAVFMDGEKGRSQGVNAGDGGGGGPDKVAGANETVNAPSNGPGKNGTLTKEVFGETVDLAREIGSLLTLALQRNRQDKGTKEDAHVRQSEKWWWAKGKRWGGAEPKWGNLACEIYEDEDPSWSPEERELQMRKRTEAEEELRRLSASAAEGKSIDVDDLLSEKQDENENKDAGPPKKKNRTASNLVERTRREPGNPNDNGKRGQGEERGEMKEGRRLMYVAPMRRRWYKEWETIRPNASTWDDKMIHRRLGAQGKDFDCVYQVSCVNHHAALMRMDISKRYLHWLETGEAEPKDVSDEDVLKVQRSRWFDLFDVEQRKEFLVGVWGVMSWLCRDEVPRAEMEKMERLREGAVDA